MVEGIEVILDFRLKTEMPRLSFFLSRNDTLDEFNRQGRIKIHPYNMLRSSGTLRKIPEE